LVVDIRPLEQRLRNGALPGAVVIDRNVLEWRLDPSSPDRIGEPDRSSRLVVIVCNEGYSSSLAAHTLQGLGLVYATDLRGGYEAWMVWKALAPGSRVRREGLRLPVAVPRLSGRMVCRHAFALPECSISRSG